MTGIPQTGIRFATLFDHASMPILVHQEGLIRYLNPACLELPGAAGDAGCSSTPNFRRR